MTAAVGPVCLSGPGSGDSRLTSRETASSRGREEAFGEAFCFLCVYMSLEFDLQQSSSKEQLAGQSLEETEVTLVTAK